jgi:8-oxo-dGTP diphosphatase
MSIVISAASREPGERADAEFLAAYDPEVFPRPSLTVDVVVLSVRGGRLCALLARRVEPPQKGRWGLPGGFVKMDESLEAAARRVVETKGGLTGLHPEQLYTFGDPGRDPRTRVISVAHLALTDLARLEEAVERQASERCVAELHVEWEGQRGGPVDAVGPDGAELRLAFDHAHILGEAVKRLRGKLDYAPVGFELLPEQFTLFQLQNIHEAVLGRELNKDSFRRRMLAGGQLADTKTKKDDVAYRPAELYRFKRDSPKQAPEGSVTVGRSTTGWPEFLRWARKFFEMPDFDQEERDYKLKAVQPLKKARKKLLSGEDFFPDLERGFKNTKLNNLVSWRYFGPFLDWARRDPTAARKALQRLWTEDDPDVATRLDAFSARFPKSVVSGPGVRCNLAAYLLGADDPKSWPNYMVRVTSRAYELTRYPEPAKSKSMGELYAHALGFFDRLLGEAAAADLVLRDRLDAQGVAWCVVHWPKRPKSFSDEDWNELLEFRAERPGSSRSIS